MITAAVAVVLTPTAMGYQLPISSEPIITSGGWSGPYRIDTQAPFAVAAGGGPVSCLSTSLCVAISNGNVITTNDPTGTDAWTQWPVHNEYEAQTLSCPTAHLCVAGGMGLLATTTDPPHGGWTVHQLDTSIDINHMDCPTTQFCAAIDTYTGAIMTTTDPTGGPAAWTNTTLPTRPMALACTTKPVCLAMDNQGTIYTSTDPTGGASTWNQASGGMGDVDQMVCPTDGFCAAVSSDGLRYTTDPASGGSTWKITELPAFDGHEGIGCSSSLTCVIVDDFGHMAATTDPAGGAGAWHVSQPGVDLAYVSCASASLCVVTGKQFGSTTDPVNGTWSFSVRDGINPMTGLSCPSSTLCVGVDGPAGNVLTSDDPLYVGSSWAAGHLTGATLTAVSCTATPLCVAGDDAGNLWTSTDPTGGAGAWTAAHVDGSHTIVAITCTEGSVCMAVDNAGNAYSSSDPSAGAGAWHGGAVLDSSTNTYFTGVGCASAQLCLATTSDGLQVVTNPAGPGSTWKHVPIDRSKALTGVSCPSTQLCVAVDADGYELWSTNPGGDAPGWHLDEQTENGYEGVSCASPALCVAWGGGDVEQSTSPTEQSPSPTGQYESWTNVVGAEGPLEAGAGSCTTTAMCIVADDYGRIYANEPVTDTPPTGSTGSAPGTTAFPSAPATGTATQQPGPGTSHSLAPIANHTGSPGPTSAVIARSARLAVRAVTVTTDSHLLRVGLTCRAGRPAGWCVGRLLITARHTDARHRETVVLARGGYRLRGGTRATVRLTVTAAGRAILRTRAARRQMVTVAGSGASRQIAVRQS